MQHLDYEKRFNIKAASPPGASFTDLINPSVAFIPDFSNDLDLKESRKFIKDLDYDCHPFTLQDGSVVGYSFPGDKKVKFSAGHRFFNWKPFNNLHKVKNGLNGRHVEKCYPKLHLWNGYYRKLWAVCIDFDEILQNRQNDSICEYRKVRKWGSYLASMNNLAGYASEAFKMGCKVLAEEYQERLGKNAFVFNSPKSGRPKALILVEYPEPVRRPSTKDLECLFEQLFPDHMKAKCIDLSRVAMSTTFIDWEDKEKFAEALLTIEPIKIEKTTKQTTFKTQDKDITVQSDFKYYVRDSLPRELEDYQGNSKFNQFLKCLCTMSGLVRNGFGISQIVMARTIGVDPKTISNYKRRAIKLGLLKVVSNQYIPNKKAKTYVACGALKAAISRCVQVAERPVKLPKKIKDGQWHSTLVSVATRALRGNLGRFLGWVKTIPGWDCGDRYYQAEAIHRWLVGKHPDLA